MRFVLALLTCFLFLNAETTFAIPAGPVTSEDTSVVGTYAGLLIPEDTSSDTLGGSGGSSGSGFDSQPTADSLGLFTMGIPDTGLGSGTFVMFSSGRVYTGTITAFGDPDAGTIHGILEATYNYTLATTANDGTITDTSVTAGVHGSMDAETQTSYNPFSNSTGTGVRISGEATLDIDQGEVNLDGTPVITDTQKFTVDGVQQSTTASSTGTSSSSTTGG